MTRKVSANTVLKYKRVVDQYFVNGFNGLEAYAEIYPNAQRKTCAVNWKKLEAIPEIKLYIKEKHEAAARIVETTHNGLLKELVFWLEADITATIGLTKEEIKQLPIKLRRLINKQKVIKKSYFDKKGKLKYTTEIIEVQFVSKQYAMEAIAKHVGLFNADNQQKATKINITTTNDKHKSLVEDIIEGIV